MGLYKLWTENGDYDKIEKLTTDVKLVLDFVRCSEDKSKLNDLITNNDEYKHMQSDAIELTKTYSGLKHVSIEIDEEGEGNMCKAWEDMKIDSEIRGEIKAYNKMNLSISEIAERTGRTEEYIIGILKESKAAVSMA